jgi:hypothetical protein
VGGGRWWWLSATLRIVLHENQAILSFNNSPPLEHSGTECRNRFSVLHRRATVVASLGEWGSDHHRVLLAFRASI